MEARFLEEIEKLREIARKMLREVYNTPRDLDLIESALATPVIFSNRMTSSAGQARMQRIEGGYYPDSIKISTPIHRLYPDQLADTYLHELAHIFANLYLNKSAGHGWVWAKVMKTLGRPAARCHSLDTSSLRKAPKRYLYMCACGKEYKLTGHKHKKVLKALDNLWKTPYYCRSCGHDLVFHRELNN